MNLRIECDSININTGYYDRQICLQIDNADLSFLNDINISDMVKNIDSELLFDELVENDEDLLHNYLTTNGYIFNKN